MTPLPRHLASFQTPTLHLQCRGEEGEGWLAAAEVSTSRGSPRVSFHAHSEMPPLAGETLIAKTRAGVMTPCLASPKASCDVRDSRTTPLHEAALGSSGADMVGASVCEVARDAKGGPYASRLLMGSADPHGLGWHERQAPLRTRPTFSSLAHAEATADELYERPFAVFNAAPVTERRELPAPPPPGAPCFNSITDIIPRSTLQLVRLWQRRLRRCLAFAAKGNVSMSRRMCPPDLWLSVEKHMTEEARPWDWDLRPLALGGAPVPWAVSGREGLRPSTDLDLAESECGAGEFADQEIIGELVTGLEDDAMCARGTLLCAPHTSALQHLALASEKLDKIVQSGWGFIADLPAWPIRACPYGLVDESERAGKPKWRLTNDLSWPPPFGMPDDEGGFVRSLNESMERSRWPQGKLARVGELAEAAAIMRLAGAPVKLWKFDCEAFYKRMGRQNAQLWRVAMVREAGMQVDTRCCFGLAADAAKCSRVSNFLQHHMRAAMRDVDVRYPCRDARILAWQSRRAAVAAECGVDCERFTALGVSAVYIDDGLGASFDDVLFERDGSPVLRNGVPLTRAVAHFEAALSAITRFGFSAAPGKTSPPCFREVFLGVEIDVLEGWMRLDPSKRKMYLRRVREALAVASMPRNQFLRLLGRLQFAALCLPRGRQWMHAAWRAVRTRFRLRSDSVLLTKSVVRDLRLWESALASELQPTAPLAPTDRIGQVGEHGVGAMYADASGTHGWAAWTCVGDTVLLTEGKWTLKERTLDISVKELYASTAGLATFAPLTGWSAVYNYTDNMVALATMRTATPYEARLQALSAARVDMLISLGIREAPERIGTKSNLWADLGSRGKGGEVVKQAAALGLSTRRVAVDASWASIAWLLLVEE